MNRTDIPIPSPCSVDWTTMTLADRGRFCGQCRKVVRELAQLTEPEARAMLASPPTEGLCVRYVHDATGEIVFRRDVVPAARLVRMKHVAIAALAAAAFPLAATGCASTALSGSPLPVMGQPPESMGAVVQGGVRPNTEPPSLPPGSTMPVAADAGVPELPFAPQ